MLEYLAYISHSNPRKQQTTIDRLSIQAMPESSSYSHFFGFHLLSSPLLSFSLFLVVLVQSSMSFVRPLVLRSSPVVRSSLTSSSLRFAPTVFSRSFAGKMSSVSASQIKEHLPVVGSDQQEIGKVDHMQGDKWIKLAKGSGTTHHYIPLDWVKSVDQKVHISKSAQEAQQQWSTNPPSS